MPAPRAYPLIDECPTLTTFEEWEESMDRLGHNTISHLRERGECPRCEALYRAERYSCLPGHLEPDWSQFRGIRVFPMVNVSDDEGQTMWEIDWNFPAEAPIWTISGDYDPASGQYGSEAITDVPGPGKGRAVELANEFIDKLRSR